ncbi:type II secretion system protein [Parazoarcus communis]|nr:type II secretion system protein [Parazoarcus communis]
MTGRIMRRGSARQRQAGYGYLLVLFLIAALGLGLAHTGEAWSRLAQREKETELLYRGADIARAIARYRALSPEGSPAWPQSLQDLIQDRRFPYSVRHLRRVWRDPFTGEPDWELVRAGGGIVGLRSRSGLVPLRTHGLPPELDPTAAQARRYADWVFRPVPGNDAPASGQQ